MNRTTAYYRKILKNDFLYSKLNKSILGISIVIFIIYFIYSSSFKPIKVFPGNNNYEFIFFTDTANNGNSVLLNYSISDSLIEMDYVLKKGFVDPYVSISISHKHDSIINLNEYNQLLLDLKGFNTENIGFDIYTPFPSKNNKYISFYDNILKIKKERKVYNINFRDLKIPDYWYVANNISPNKRIKPNLKRVSYFNIGTAYTNNFEVQRKLRIYSIQFKRDNTRSMVVLLIIEAVLIALLVFIHLAKKQNLFRSKQIEITYKPVESSKKYDDEYDNQKELADALNYINDNFNDSEISLEKVAKNIGINKRNISVVIQKNYSCNFKYYINLLRIHESKRLLKETDLSMGEIANKVGFNTQSHFNRVFKSAEGKSPSDFKITDY